jgi:iron complex outermembrane receptor protein
VASRLSAQQDTARSAPTLEPIEIRARGGAPALPLAITRDSAGELSVLRSLTGLDQLLQRFPGVVAQDRSNFALDTRISVRGFGARSAFGVRGVTLLLDGVPLTLADGQAQLTVMDLASVHEITVVRGASAAFYGNAAGGVISVESRPLIGGAKEAQARLESGDFGFRRADVSLRTPLAGGGVALDLSRLVVDGFRSHSAAELRHAGIAASLLLGQRTILTTRARVGDLVRAQNPGALTAAELAADPTQASPRNLAQDAGKSAREWQGAMQLRRAGGRGDVVALLHATHRDLENPLSTAYVRLDRVATGARVGVRWSLGEGVAAPALLAGLDVQRQADRRRNFANLGGEPGDSATVAQRETVWNLGGRVAVVAAVAPRTSLTVGLRGDRVGFRVDDELPEDGDDSGERLMSALSFTAGVSHQPRAGLTLYAGVGSSFETPTTTELALPGTGGFSSELGPQRALQWEMGARHEGGRFRGMASIYRTGVRDGLLQYELPAAPGRFEYRNTARSRHQGVELELLWLPAAWVRLAVSATRIDARFTSYPTDSAPLDGRLVPGIPRSTVFAELRVAPRGAPWVSLDLTRSGPMAADDANSAVAPQWTALNLRAGWEVAAQGAVLRPFAGVRNLLDEIQVRSVNVNGAAGRYYEPSPGRSAYLGIELVWRASRGTVP